MSKNLLVAPQFIVIDVTDDNDRQYYGPFSSMKDADTWATNNHDDDEIWQIEELNSLVPSPIQPVPKPPDTLPVDIRNEGGLLCDFHGYHLGYILCSAEHGAFEPHRGFIPGLDAATANTHNATLSRCEINGLDEAPVGKGRVFYYVDGRVQTWHGDMISETVTATGRMLTFTRNGKVFTGRFGDDSDAVMFLRQR